uniref:Uncharacterized protein n=1 Tax=Cacopsylla melanoneura TaxID=428564 RepID=A0A8D9EAP3_9HEMI
MYHKETVISRWPIIQRLKSDANIMPNANVEQLIQYVFGYTAGIRYVNMEYIFFLTRYIWVNMKYIFVVYQSCFVFIQNMFVPTQCITLNDLCIQFTYLVDM